jgi:hypothetical protein
VSVSDALTEAANGLLGTILPTLPFVLFPIIVIGFLPFVFRMVKQLISGGDYVPVTSAAPAKPRPVNEAMRRQAIEAAKPRPSMEAPKAAAGQEPCSCPLCRDERVPVQMTPPSLDEWAGWEHYGLVPVGTAAKVAQR